MNQSSTPTDSTLGTRTPDQLSESSVAPSSIGRLGRLSRRAGHALDFIGSIPLLRNPIVRRFAGLFKLGWLIGLSHEVDLEKAAAKTKEFQQLFPAETANQIAHRLMVRKAVQAAGTGLITSILPGFAIALFAIDIAAMTALQTALVYEIAAAYGLDLREPERRGEVLAIFGLGIGGGNIIRAGLRFLRNVPIVGAAIGAGSNAALIYSLGYAASRFYEAKRKGVIHAQDQIDSNAAIVDQVQNH